VRRRRRQPGSHAVSAEFNIGIALFHVLVAAAKMIYNPRCDEQVHRRYER